jgi:NAD+ diphosphatase
MSLAFVVHPLDRRAAQRGDGAWLSQQRSSPVAKLVQLHGDSALLAAGALVTAARWDDVVAAEAVFLGVDGEGAPWFAAPRRAAAVEVPGPGGPLGGAHELRDLRSLALSEALPPEQLGILAQARALLHWHARHRFCAACGASTEATDGGNRRRCAACGTEHFPRTDPVAIMVVRHQGRVLLGRQKAWRPGMYSALAGFLEPGETLEDGARREVLEEAGVRVGAVQYVASQPWPFPASLMIGLIGEALSTEIRLDDHELEDARWFDAEEARAMVERTHSAGLYAANPMAIAHQLVRAALGLAPRT